MVVVACRNKFSRHQPVAISTAAKHCKGYGTLDNLVNEWNLLLITGESILVLMFNGVYSHESHQWFDGHGFFVTSCSESSPFVVMFSKLAFGNSVTVK